MVVIPETYHLKPKEHCPNNRLPVLIYRDCLPLPLSEERVTDFLESHAWVKKGCWGHIGQRHFHPNTHECYGMFVETLTYGAPTWITHSSGDPEPEELLNPELTRPLLGDGTGIFQGSSTLLLGCGHNDTTDGGLEVEVHTGDVIVLPAGTGHCSIQSSKDYKYIGVYPEGAPHWTNQLGKSPVDLEAFRRQIEAVDIPSQDPVNGDGGPLTSLWTR